MTMDQLRRLVVGQRVKALYSGDVYEVTRVTGTTNESRKVFVRKVSSPEFEIKEPRNYELVKE